MLRNPIIHYASRHTSRAVGAVLVAILLLIGIIFFLAHSDAGDTSEQYFNSTLALKVCAAREGAIFGDYLTDRRIGCTPAPKPGIKLATDQHWYVHPTSRAIDDEQFAAICREVRKKHILALSLQAPTSQVSHEGWAPIGTLSELKWLSLKDLRGKGQRSQVADVLEHVANLSELEVIDLSNTGVPCQAIAPLRTLRHLISINLGGNRITDECVQHLAAMPLLTTLGLRGADITEDVLMQIAALRGLRCLDISFTKCGNGALMELRRAESLVELNMDDTLVDDETIKALSGLRKIRSIGLGGVHGTKISSAGLSQLQQWPELESLRISNVDLSERICADLRVLQNLRSVALNRCQPIGSHATALLANLQSLRTLDLSGTAVTAGALLSLSSNATLVNLTLDGSEIGNDGMRVVGTMKSLRLLNLADSKADDEGVSLLSGLRNIESLNLNTTMITDRSVQVIGAMTGLQNVFLARTKITDRGLISLCENRKDLRVLQLSGTTVSDAGISSLRKLGSLHWLDVSGCERISDEGLRAIGEISSLEILVCSAMSKITDSGMRDLRAVAGRRLLIIQ